MSVYDVAMKYQEDNTPLIVLAGSEYGSGSSWDWAANSLGLSGNEIMAITGIGEGLALRKELTVTAKKEDGSEIVFKAIARLDSEIEIEYVKHGGILQYVLRQFLKE